MADTIKITEGVGTTIATDDVGGEHYQKVKIADGTADSSTALEVATEDSAAKTTGLQGMGKYDSTKPTAVGDGDAVTILTDQYGRLLRGVEPQRFQATITSSDATSPTQVKAKTASNKMYILSLIVSTDTAMNIQFQDDAGTPNVLIEQMYFAANAEAPLVVDTNQDLDVVASAAGNISVTVTGYLAP